MVSNHAQSFSENEDSLAHLSAQLKAHGYLTRSLDLLSLFVLPPPPLFTSHEQTDKQVRTALQQASQARQAEDQAREQIVRCLWNMLGARVDATTAIERLSTELRVLEYDHERANGILAKEREKRVVAEKEAMAEKAKAKASADALTAEMARHRHAKEELTKSRSALQFVKTQAQHDQKRRESELASALQRVQRQTSDPLQPKFTIINPITKAGRAPAVASRLAHAGELALLEEALEECDSSRRRAQEENGELRELVGEVEEWSTEMVKLRGVGSDNPAVEFVHNGLPRHLTASVDVLAPSVYQKLYEIRTSIVTLIESTDDQIKQAQDEMDDALETERQGHVEAKLARTKAEKLLDDATTQVAASEKLIFDFMNKTSLAGPTVEARDGAMYDDETPAERAGLLALPVMDSDSQRAKDLEKNELSEEIARVAREKVEAEARRAAAVEAQRVADVAAFLKELEDSPAPVSTLLRAKIPSVVPTPVESSPMIPEPTIELPAVSKVKKASSKPRQLETLVEQSFSVDSVAPLDDVTKAKALPPPSPFLSSAPTVALSRSVHEQRRTSALADILSMADSPPLRPPTLVSSRGGSMAAREARERAATEAGAGKENEFLESVQTKTVTKKTVTAVVKQSERDGGAVKAGKQREVGPVLEGRLNVF